MKKVFLTGAGAPGGPGIIKALQQAGYPVLTGDANEFASGRFLSADFIRIPKAEEENFIPFVLDVCIKNEIDIIFPLVTKELFKFARAKQMFAENNIHVIVSEFDSLAIANDKGKLYQHLFLQNIPVPKFEVVRTIEELKRAATELAYPGKPICIKPTISNGSRGVRILQENKDEYDLLFHHKPNHLYSTLNRLIEILEARSFPELLVSEYLPGQEFSIDAIVQNGIPKLILPRSRVKINAGISMQGTFIRHQKIIDYCDRIIRSLKLSGPIGIQVKEDEQGEFRLLEINPRIQGTSVAALGLGINLPALAIQQEFETIEIDAGKLPWGTSFVRYYEEVFYK